MALPAGGNAVCSVAVVAEQVGAGVGGGVHLHRRAAVALHMVVGVVERLGEGDLVVMSIEAYSYREEMLNLKEKLLEAEAQRISGTKTYSLDEINQQLERLINGAE